MTPEFSLALIAGIGLPIMLALLGGMVHLVWMLSSLKTTVENIVTENVECKKKHARHDSDFKDVRNEIATLDNKVGVLDAFRHQKAD